MQINYPSDWEMYDKIRWCQNVIDWIWFVCEDDAPHFTRLNLKRKRAMLNNFRTNNISLSGADRGQVNDLFVTLESIIHAIKNRHSNFVIRDNSR